MAKTATPKKTAPKKTATSKTPDFIKVAETVLQKLETHSIDQKLQSELQWCIGSYKHDQNPVGLLEKLADALVVLKAENAKKTKGITATLIKDVEKVLAV
jgi:hypothetical protein